MTKAIVAIIAVILIAGGGYLATHKNKTAPAASSQSSSQSSAAQNSTAAAAATITYDGNSFSPSSITVKSGDKVEIKNTSSTDVQFQSNPHPLHTDDTDLNVGLVSAGQSATFTVTKTGTFGYHNHLNPDQGGTITIQ